MGLSAQRLHDGLLTLLTDPGRPAASSEKHRFWRRSRASDVPHCCVRDSRSCSACQLRDLHDEHLVDWAFVSDGDVLSEVRLLWQVYDATVDHLGSVAWQVVLRELGLLLWGDADRPNLGVQLHAGLTRLAVKVAAWCDDETVAGVLQRVVDGRLRHGQLHTGAPKWRQRDSNLHTWRRRGGSPCGGATTWSGPPGSKPVEVAQ